MLYGRRAAPLVDRPEPSRPEYRYHHHLSGGSLSLMGNMSMKPEWPSDGTCPPECPLPRREDLTSKDHA